MNSPSAIKPLTARAAAPSVSVGRMIEQVGNLRLRKMVGSGMIRLVWSQFAVGVEVGEHQPVRGIGQGRRIAGFVVPGLEVHDLGAADAEQDAQHLRVGDPLGQRGVEAGAALLDEREVEARRVGDRLEVVRRGEVGVGSGNRRKLPLSQAWDGLRERVAEVGVLRVAAVARPPTRVHGELHQVGEPARSAGRRSRCCPAGCGTDPD